MVREGVVAVARARVLTELIANPLQGMKASLQREHRSLLDHRETVPVSYLVSRGPEIVTSSWGFTACAPHLTDTCE